MHLFGHHHAAPGSPRVLHPALSLPPPATTSAHPSTEQLGADRLDRAQFAFVQQAFRGLGFGRITQVLSDHQRHARLVGGCNHVPALLHGNRHGFLAYDVFAGFGGCDGQRRMGVVRGADVDGLDVGLAQHLFHVQVDGVGVDAGFPGKLLGERLNEVTNGVELHPIGTFQVGGQVCAGNTAGPYDADFEWIGHWFSLSPCGFLFG